MAGIAPLDFTHDDCPDRGTPYFEAEFDSDMNKGHEVVDRAIGALKELDHFNEERQAYHAWLCLDELVTNAIRHGNRCDATKVGRLQIFLDAGSWIARVYDQGAGFDPREVSDPLQNLESDHGRGIFLVRSLVDRVAYYRGGRCAEFQCATKRHASS